MGSIHAMLAVTLLGWVSQAHRGARYNVSVYPTFCVQPVDNARNQIVREFLKSDCTHLLFVDADTIPPVSAIDRLLDMDVPIASAITPIISPDEIGDPVRKWNCVGMDDNHVRPGMGVVPVKGAGASCLLIKREVFERMPDPWFRFVYRDDTGKSTMVSEDIYFVVSALGKGFRTYADTSIICRHNKPFTF